MSASQVELYNGTINGSGAGAAKQIATNTMGMVTIALSGISATPALEFWLQGSNDGGTTWQDLFHNGVLPHTGTATEGTLEVAKRNIVSNKTDTAAQSFCAIYPWLPCKHVRLAWTFTGGTPAATLLAHFGGK